MTRATLLRLLAHSTALNGADVRALEELAEAFPYCQTAHLLLAKAAHDQGSMLAGQRLRQAATYAADRALLRQLIEAAPIEELADTISATASAAEYAGGQNSTYKAVAPEAVQSAPPPAEAPTPAPLLLEDKPAQEISPAPSPYAAKEAATELAAPAASLVAATLVEPVALLATEPASALAEPLPLGNPAATQEPATTAITPLSTSPEAATLAAADSATTMPAAAETAYPAPAPEPLAAASAPEPLGMAAELDLPGSAEVANPTLPSAAALAEVPVDAHNSGVSEPVVPALGDELLPQAPPIRPPAEAEAAHYEYGLSPAEPAEITAYQLPELALAITIPLSLANATPRLPPFGGVAEVAYAPSEGSRLGYCLVPTTLGLAGEAPAPLMPAASLPLAGEFFAPDALVLMHIATQPAPIASSTTELINSFLQRKPSQPRRRAQPPAKTSEQADLSVRSTRAAPDLASESLAKILTQQGKIEQAIAIYERLMVKSPEKIAYFAAQIDLLRP
ncbi:MAG: hypothetical protein ACRYFK_20065 [Janthinobacterium lividum]